LKATALDSIRKIEEDYKREKFDHINPFTTMTYGVQMNNIEEILITTIGNDSVHYGDAWALKKII